MRRTPWAAFLWPGVPQLVGRGSWTALVVALGAAALLNVALLATFAWTELLAPNLRILYWLLLLGAWSGGAGLSLWIDRRRRTPAENEDGKDLFRDTLDHYLQGNWPEAEEGLGRLLRRNRRDVEARLMLATLLRHRGRPEEAARQLEALCCSEEAGKWELEISREKQLLARECGNRATERTKADSDVREEKIIS